MAETERRILSSVCRDSRRAATIDGNSRQSAVQIALKGDGVMFSEEFGISGSVAAEPVELKFRRG